MKMIRYVVVLSMLALSACSLTPEKSLQGYDLESMRHQRQKDVWYFEGRLAVVDERDSVTVSINWRHGAGLDRIELVGPLAQGRLLVQVTAGDVVIDDGEGRQQYQGSADLVLTEQLGVEVPVDALRYWVLGLVDPAQEFTVQTDGFYQGGWLVRFREMQAVGVDVMPKKMTVEKDKTRIKLIVDQWEFS